MDCSPLKPTWRFVAGVLLLCCLLLSGRVSAEERALVVLSGEQPVYQRFLTTFESVWPRDQSPLVVQDLYAFDPTGAAIILAVGAQATQHALQADIAVPILSTLLPALSFRQLLEDLPDGYSRLQQGNLHALFLDQPLARQLRLIQLLVPDIKHLGTLLGTYSQTYLPDLQALTAQAGIQLHYQVVSENDNPLAALSPIIEASDAFLVLPDRSSFNRATARWILQLSYREQVPVFGYSRSYSDAGALASLHTSPELIARQAAQLLRQRLDGPDAWKGAPQYPSNFSISLNLPVARSLFGREPDPVLLQQELKALEIDTP